MLTGSDSIFSQEKRQKMENVGKYKKEEWNCRMKRFEENSETGKRYELREEGKGVSKTLRFVNKSFWNMHRVKEDTNKK